jgi:hypothetical protein
MLFSSSRRHTPETLTLSKFPPHLRTHLACFAPSLQRSTCFHHCFGADSGALAKRITCLPSSGPLTMAVKMLLRKSAAPEFPDVRIADNPAHNDQRKMFLRIDNDHSISWEAGMSARRLSS